MTDDQEETEMAPPDADASEEWVESIAATEGIPPEEVIERLVSSYWTLTEMHDMLGGLDDGIEFDADIDPDGAEEATREEIEVLRERLDRLEADLGEEHEARVAVAADLTELTQQVDAVADRAADRHESLESRLDTELENLETILEHLLDTTDALEADLASVSEEMEAVGRRRAERERLTRLRRIARQLGVRSAVCEHCGTSVDVGLLQTTDCPHCDRRFVDVDPATGWFGLGSDTLVTARDGRIDEPGQGSPGEGANEAGRHDGG
jgi:rubrerythrin